MTPARSALVATAGSLVGLVGLQYKATISSPEIAAADYLRADEMATMSGCELVWHALVRQVFDGLDADEYVTGAAFRDFDRVAGRAKRTATSATPPQPGDAIEWGASGAYPAHVDACVVLDLSGRLSPAVPFSVLHLTVVAGGQQRTAEEFAAGEPGILGEETVKRIERTVSWMGGQWVDVHTGRAVIGVVDADVMAELYALRG